MRGAVPTRPSPHTRLVDAGWVLLLFCLPEAGWLSLRDCGRLEIERRRLSAPDLDSVSDWRFPILLRPLRLLAALALLPSLWNCGSKRLPVPPAPVVRSEPVATDPVEATDLSGTSEESDNLDFPVLASVGGEPSLIHEVLEIAASQIGIPYRWGGDSPESGFDCSGFVRWVFDQLGVELPRDSVRQAGVGVAVERKNLRPGDLVFYSRRPGSKRVGHVGIYLGDDLFLHSPRRGRPIEVSPAFDRYRQSVYLGARRVLSDSEPDPAARFDVAGSIPVSLPREEPSHYYVVKKGDYIWALARRFNLSPVQLLRANKMNEEDVLRIGQRLLIPEPER